VIAQAVIAQAVIAQAVIAQAVIGQTVTGVTEANGASAVDAAVGDAVAADVTAARALRTGIPRPLGKRPAESQPRSMADDLKPRQDRKARRLIRPHFPREVRPERGLGLHRR
jgi:hypothetical protein